MELHSRKLLQFYYEPPDFTDESPLTYSPPPPNITAASSPSPPPKKTIQVSPSNLHVSLDSSMAVTILVLLTALFFLGFFSIYIRRFSGDSIELSRRRRYNYHSTPSSFSSPSDYPQRLARRKGLDPSTVRSLPVYTYIKDAMYQIDCAVCLSEFEEEENVKVIPHCKHVFHKECIDTWLLSHVSCPVCRGTQLFDEKGGGSGVTLPQERTSEPERRSTVENEETCIEVREEEGTLGMRRSRSCSSSLEERATLQRTWSMRLCDSWGM